MYRQEHPNPQFVREDWQNLNGEWDFAFDFGNSGKERKFYEMDGFDKKINVPFCPESKLSGIEYKDFMNAVWYMRRFDIPAQKLENKRVFIHFGAVDYSSVIYINKKEVFTHKGGYTPFSVDITDYVTPGENTVCVYAEDDNRHGLQPCGKQSHIYYSQACDYTRTTGIWQTVWLEFVPESYIKTAKYYPDQDNSCIVIQGTVAGKGTLTLQAEWEGQVVGTKKIQVNNGCFSTQMDLSEVHLWEAGKGGLYDLTITFGEDQVKSYFGIRTTGFEGLKYMFNGKSLFLRTVLDQGYYQDGIYTAPTEADLVKDIELSYAAGFNGARLHEKVFEPRFLYHCDKMGYLVWGEYPNWGLEHANPMATEIYLNEWSEAIERDFNHPAIIGWCPFNETWGYFEDKEKNALISSIYKLTKRLDPTRPCIDSSGNHRVISEVYDIHDYQQNPEIYKRRWDNFTNLVKEKGGKLPLSDEFFTKRGITSREGSGPFFEQPYDNQPIFISEYGGIRWVDESISGWGYGNAPKDAQEFFERYKGLTEAMLFNESICGFCYTQLYDIEQEVNGLYTYERKQKFDINIIKEINQQKAKIED